MTRAAFRVAVVGSGPSGTYTAQALCESAEDVTVDVYERLPVPFGLVRYGVAPDHQKIKSVVGTFNEVYADPRVRFLGNVQVGRDVTIRELCERYSAVVVASGAAADRRLGIPGEAAAGVWSSTDFVAWYSGHPDAAVDRFTLDAERVVIVGAGNVALDVARILCRTPDEMRATDVPEHVVEVLAESRIRDVRLVARRGMEHAKFSARELDELAALTDTELLVDPHEVPAGAQGLSPLARRMVTALAGFGGTERPDARRRIRFDFGWRPTALRGDPLEAVELASTLDTHASPRAAPAELLIRAVGYRAEPFPGVPFDTTTCTVPHDAGRVLDEADEPVEGLYVVGWIKRGPSGVIGTNRVDAVETVGSLLEDRRQRPLAAILTQGNVQPSEQGSVISWQDWQRIDNAELRYGSGLGRNRVKLHEHIRLMDAARRHEQRKTP